MKNLITVLIFAIALVSGFQGKAQNLNRNPNLRERMAHARMNEIQMKFKLDQATFDHFRPIYLKYENEISGIDFRKMAKLLKVDPDSISAADAETLIMNQLESAKKIISLREKYYKEFRTILTPQQIVKLYQIEAELRKEVTEEIKNRRKNF
ncbi:MAG: hypothetical protein WCP08_11755 [Prolixibacteraceae bacterium]